MRTVPLKTSQYRLGSAVHERIAATSRLSSAPTVAVDAASWTHGSRACCSANEHVTAPYSASTPSRIASAPASEAAVGGRRQDRVVAAAQRRLVLADRVEHRARLDRALLHHLERQLQPVLLQQLEQQRLELLLLLRRLPPRRRELDPLELGLEGRLGVEGRHRVERGGRRAAPRREPGVALRSARKAPMRAKLTGSFRAGRGGRRRPTLLGAGAAPQFFPRYDF